MNDCIECLSKVLDDLISTTKRLAEVTKGIESRLTDLEKISGHLTSIVSGANLRLTALEARMAEVKTEDK